MTVYVTLTTAGADTGPFNLYSDIDGYVSAFETGVSKAALLAGYTSTVAPDGTAIVRVMSDGVCKNYIDLPVSPCTTTTTTTVALCATYNLSGGIGGGSWSALECGTLNPVGGDVGEGGQFDSGCIVISSLLLSNVSASAETNCNTTTTTTTIIPPPDTIFCDCGTGCLAYVGTVCPDGCTPC